MAGGLVSGVVAVVLATVAALGAVSSGGATPPSATGSAHGGCFPAGARQLARDADVRVFAASASSRAPRLAAPPVYACDLRRGRRVALNGGGGFVRVTPVAVAGPVVAYGLASMGVDTTTSTIGVLNVATGARHSLAAASTPRRPETFTTVASLVVTRGASAAWIAGRSGIGQPQPSYEVWRLRRGATTLLDAGAAIAANSLRRHGSAVTWSDAGRSRSAPLA